MKNPNLTLPSNNKSGYQIIWGGFIAGIFFLLILELANGFSAFQPLFLILLVALTIIAFFVIVYGYYVTLKLKNKNLWWLLLFIPLTPLILFFISIILTGIVYLLLGTIGSIFQLYI